MDTRKNRNSLFNRKKNNVNRGGTSRKSRKSRKLRVSRKCSTKPNSTHRIQVSSIHKIYYCEFGNPCGEPVFVIHGGPGDHSRFDNVGLFDCKKYRIIFIDQRGCGRSRPVGEIKDNTTDDLVDDIEKVRVAAGLGGRKIQLFGVSWGTFLSLSYAIKYPSNVSRIVLRSVFLCSKSEYDDVENGQFVRKMFPDVHEEYVRGAKNPERATDEYYDKILSGKPGDKRGLKYLKKVSDYENILLSLHPNKRGLQRKFDKKDVCLAKLSAHYFSNRCFARDIMSNIHKIEHIPTTIVQGRYDAVTPAYYAYKLHKALPKSKIYFTVAGHMMTDEGNYEKVREIFGGV